MFRLYILDYDQFKTALVYSFYDLVNGFTTYREEAEKRGIEIVHVRNERTDDIIKRGDNVNCFFSIWGNMVDHGSELYKDRKFLTASFLDDIHWWTEPNLNARMTFFERTDFIFTPYARTAKTYDIYKPFHSKFIQLHWWAPDACFQFDVPWANRKDKIILSGSVSVAYPLRMAISKSKDSNLERLTHCQYPNYVHPYHGVGYYEYLSRHKGAVATSAARTSAFALNAKYDPTIIHPLDYTVSKNFEILGSGCLGFLEETADFLELGFEPYKNFIPITLTTYKDQWRRISDPAVESIASAGREFVRVKHSTKNRVITILDAIKNKIRPGLK